ncbi:MAG: MATE family efflux transporter [Lachnospiraceae bacterium]|nr:MATE family efflux transporter [Lachnospiraceae bacterium]
MIQLSEHFTYSKLIRFVIPSIIMMIFTSIYGVIDGLFVSNFVGKTPFAAINLILPFLMLFGALGFMIGTGGSAIIAVTLGEGKEEKANQYFSLLVYCTIVIGVLLTILGLFMVRPIAITLGATGEMLENCILYGYVLMPVLTAFMLQNVFQSFMVTAEKPRLGLGITVLAGITNILLDALFVAVLKWGLIGAALATAISQIIGGFLPLVYFARPNPSRLKLVKTSIYPRVLLQTCLNGSSELMVNVSLSLVNMLYNFQLMRLAGENGIAAYGVIMYVNFIFISAFIGYSIGSGPIVGYHYGAGHTDELKNMFRKSMVFITVTGVVLTITAELLAYPLSHIFVGYDKALLDMTHRGFALYSIAFFFMGYSIYGSGFFTALNNGLVSALISFLRTLLFQILAVLLLPMIFGLDGVWTAIVVAEAAALFVTFFFLIKMRGKYKYA